MKREDRLIPIAGIDYSQPAGQGTRTYIDTCHGMRMNAPAKENLVARVEERILDERDNLIEMRRYFHRHPELSLKEFETTKKIASHLESLGFEVRVRPEGTGLLADIAPPDFDPDIHPTVAIRSDIDALPIDELNEVPYRSQNEGVMHACGHDVHMAMVYGSGLGLAAHIDELPGRIRLIYQHAEETVPGGATDMVAFGAVEGVDAVLGLHCDPELAVGKIGVRPGPFTASFDLFEFTVRGKGGHGARPHQCVDSIFVATQLCNALYQLTNQVFDARKPSVITIGTIHGGTVANVIPEEVKLTGSIRTIDPDHRNQIEDHLHRIAGGICMTYGANYKLHFEHGAPSIRNNAEITDLFAEIGADLLGEDNVYEIPLPSMGGEDFSYYCERVPGAMFRLGTATAAPSHFLHSPNFDIDERSISIGSRILARSALRLLHEKALTKKTDRLVHSI